MSSSSLYEPDDGEASGSDIDPQPSTSKPKLPDPPSSSPHIQELRLSSEPSDQNVPTIVPRFNLGTHHQAYGDILSSLTKPSQEAYSRLLAETVNDLPPVPTDFIPELYRGGQQVGAVFWSNQEKEIFFRALSRKGKNGIKEIAKAVASKSELEVQEFLRLLQRGLEQANHAGLGRQPLALDDIPAAVEIGDQCCEMLDKHAELVSYQEWYRDDVAGRKKYFDTWIIDQDKAEEIDRQVEDEDDNTPVHSSAHLAARILFLGNWTRLSERIFMNSYGAMVEGNWRNLRHKDEEPSMTAEALDDFYALTISVTRRLVHSSLFFAMSRLRTSNDDRLVKRVRKGDVRSALSALNMKHNRYEYWVGVARRLCLKVKTRRNRKGSKTVYLSYDEVEDDLAKRLHKEASTESSISKPTEESPQNLSIEEDDGYTSKADVENARSSPADLVHKPDDELPVDYEVEHAEKLDHRTSNLEELHLWKALGRPVPDHLDIPAKSEDEGADLGKARRRYGTRKTGEELVDWRDRTLYRNEWEEHGDGILDIYKQLVENRRKRRRTDKRPTARAYSDSDADTDGDSGPDGGAARVKRARTDYDSEPGPAGDGEMEVDDEISISNDRPETTKIEAADPEVEREAEYLNQMLGQGSEEYDHGVNPDDNSHSPRASRKGKDRQQTDLQSFKPEPREVVEPDEDSDQNVHSEVDESTGESPSPARPQRRTRMNREKRTKGTKSQ